jgi:intein/homing endonuclease
MKGLSGSVNTYSLIKSIAEEIRGLAVEFNVPIWSATQVTRAGYSSSDIEITDTSECIAITESVTMRDGQVKTLDEVKLGDQITANDEYKTVMFKHHNKMKDCVKITTESGKSIIVSKDHVFPCKNNGNVKRISVNTGLNVSDILSVVLGKM